MPTHPGRLATVLCASALVMTLASCGDDDPAPEAASPTTARDSTNPAGSSDASPTGGSDEFCAAAQAIADGGGFPTQATLRTYRDAAPDEVRIEAETVTDALADVPERDAVAFSIAIADDRVEEDLDVLTAYETETCGIETDEPPLPQGAVREVEAAAAQVTVRASDYAFEAPDSIDSGRTTFTLENTSSAEAHHLAVVRVADGVSYDEAVASHDGSGFAEAWATGAAAPGQDEVDLEHVTFDVEAGTYALLCFLPGPGGAPHIAMGMTRELTVT